MQPHTYTHTHIIIWYRICMHVKNVGMTDIRLNIYMAMIWKCQRKIGRSAEICIDCCSRGWKRKRLNAQTLLTTETYCAVWNIEYTLLLRQTNLCMSYESRSVEQKRARSRRTWSEFIFQLCENDLRAADWVKWEWNEMREMTGKKRILARQALNEKRLVQPFLSAYKCRFNIE